MTIAGAPSILPSKRPSCEPAKTFTMSFGVNALNSKCKPLKYNDGQPITPKAEGRYLGMMFFTNRAFRQAQKKLLEKAKARLWAIYRVMTTKYMAAAEAIQRVFTACIQASIISGGDLGHGPKSCTMEGDPATTK